MMNSEKKIKDKIIKLILIIIIILLLIHNCTLIKKRGKEKTPSGNVNIIEITCEDNNKCDVTPNKDKNGTVTIDDNNETGGSGSTGTKKKSTTGNDNNDSSNSGSSSGSSNSGDSGGSSSSSGENTFEDDEEEPDGELFVRDSKLVWDDESELKIFTNSVYNFEEKIAPESSNTYQFIVKNSTSYNIKYNMTFIETNPYNINMKYKLKKNNAYIVDHYVSFNELNISDQLLDAKNNDTYYLEWKWFSADNDNQAGENRAGYQLKINVEAESTNG